MVSGRISLLVLALLSAGPSWGQAPETSIRPQARPGAEVAPVVAAVEAPAVAPGAAAEAEPSPVTRSLVEFGAAEPPALPRTAMLALAGQSVSITEAAAAESTRAMTGPPVADGPAPLPDEPAPSITSGPPPSTPPASPRVDLVSPAGQQAVQQSVRAALAPPPRPGTTTTPQGSTMTIAEAAAVENAAAAAAGEAERARAEVEAEASAEAAPENPLAVPNSLIPQARRQSVVARYAALAAERQRARNAPEAATPVALRPERDSGPSQRGLCGVPGLQGRELSRIRASTQGCGIAEPVSVTSVQGIPLSSAATIDCTTAGAFDAWMRTQAMPALGNTGGGIAQIRIGSHYACRPRNNQRGARISEHGRGRAIDVSGFRMRNGEVITVLQHYRRGPYSRAMQRMYAGACGIFRTTLGPGSDRFHEDHFHFDLAQHRNGGTYCR